jgi:transporter family-2 protein
MKAAILLPSLLAFLAGALVAVQAPTNALLARAGGSPVLAALISFGVGTLALLVLWLLTAPRPFAATLTGLPWYAWIGGAYGAVYVTVAVFAAPRIGLASLLTIGIAGQIVMALWLDHVGAFGLAREPINVARVAGAVLVGLGVLLVRRG